MRLTIVQTALHWENPAANRAELAQTLAPLAGQTDLIVLPEMFTTGFSMSAATLAEDMDGPTVQWLREQARRLGSAVTGSFVCHDGRHHRNRLVFMRPDGQFHHYDKRHLFGLAGENDVYTAGTERLTVEWMGWHICPLVCYDLRFPVWSRQVPAQPYDLLLYVANWPARRGHHWRSLLPARAIENQCCVAAVNIVGTDGNGHEYQGDSGVWDHTGQSLCQMSGHAGLFTATLRLSDLQAYRKQLPFLSDSDAFSLL
ncbi:MAG: amidohydrolase [Saprospiraceae bacterium]